MRDGPFAMVIQLVVPWLVILSGSVHYRLLRITGAVFAMMASIEWIVERIRDTSNGIVEITEQIFSAGRYIVLALMLLSIVYYFSAHKTQEKS